MVQILYCEKFGYSEHPTKQWLTLTETLDGVGEGPSDGGTKTIGEGDGSEDGESEVYDNGARLPVDRHVCLKVIIIYEICPISTAASIDSY